MSVATAETVAVKVDAAGLRKWLVEAKKVTRARFGDGLLAHVLVDLDGGRMVATNLEVWLVRDLPRGGTGRVLVTAAELSAAVKGKGDASLAVDGGGRALRVECGGAATVVAGFGDAAGFPPLPVVDSSTAITLRDTGAWSACAATASTDESRPILTGVLVDVKDRAATITATDAYRLHWQEGIPATGPQVEGEWLVPAKALATGLKLAAAAKTEAVLHLPSGGKVTGAVSHDGGMVLFRAIEGDFPNWRPLVDGAGDGAPFDVHGAALVDGCKACPAGAGEPIILSGAADNDRMLLEVVADGKSWTRMIDGTAPVARVGLNPKFLAHAVEAAHGKGAGVVRFRSVDAMKPIFTEGVNGSHLLMPVRVR